MIEWIFKNLGVVIFVVIVISQLLRGAARARKAEQAPPPAAPEDYDEQRRTREIQERVRRQIAERRGAPAPTAPAREVVPAAPPRAETTQQPELFGGPLGRMLEELQKRAQPQPAPAEPPQLVVARADHAELERQAKLTAELQTLEETRRRAAHRAADVLAKAEAEPALRSAHRVQLLGDLSHPQSLRRAMVLREVLGPPVALR